VGTGAVALGLTLGDDFSGLLSQKLRSRKIPIAINIGLLAVLLLVFFFVPLPGTSCSRCSSSRSGAPPATSCSSS